MRASATNTFWETFTKKSWEKSPLLVKNFDSSIVKIDQDEIFKMLVDYSDKCRKIESSDGFKLYIDGQMLHPTETLQFLPDKSDKSLIGYHDRMEEYFSDYCLVCDELLQTSQKNWSRLQEFTSNLFAHVGFPNRFVEIGLYLGNYRKTPFGVHVDGCGVFSFPVFGKKIFRLWTPEFAKKNSALNRALNYNRFKKYSTTMKASIGDMVYWPSSAWHIAESNGSFNATWSLGVWVDRTHQQNLEAALSPLLKSKLGSSGMRTSVKHQTPFEDGELRQLPVDYLHSISTIKSLSEDDLHDAFMRNWLILSSAEGFKNSPFKKMRKKLTLKSRLRISDSKILWCHLKTETKSLYAFHGKLLEAQRSAEVLKLIKHLNMKKSCLIADYLKGSTKKQDLKLLQTLCEAGAFAG